MDAHKDVCNCVEKFKESAKNVNRIPRISSALTAVVDEAMAQGRKVSLLLYWLTCFYHTYHYKMKIEFGG